MWCDLFFAVFCLVMYLDVGGFYGLEVVVMDGGWRLAEGGRGEEWMKFGWGSRKGG